MCAKFDKIHFLGFALIVYKLNMYFNHGISVHCDL